MTRPLLKLAFFFDLRLFCACASGTNNSNFETEFEHRWTNTFIRIFDLFVSPLYIMILDTAVAIALDRKLQAISIVARVQINKAVMVKQYMKCSSDSRPSNTAQCMQINQKVTRLHTTTVMALLCLTTLSQLCEEWGIETLWPSSLRARPSFFRFICETRTCLDRRDGAHH